MTLCCGLTRQNAQKQWACCASTDALHFCSAPQVKLGIEWTATLNACDDWSAAKRPGAGRLVLCATCAITVAMAALSLLIHAATSKTRMSCRDFINDVIKIGRRGSGRLDALRELVRRGSVGPPIDDSNDTPSSDDDDDNDDDGDRGRGGSCSDVHCDVRGDASDGGVCARGSSKKMRLA